MIYLLPQIIETSARKFPDKAAFRFRTESLSYAALAQQSNQLANVLVEQGVEPGDRVGIFLPKCLETAVAVYGIMQAGAAYVPLDPKMPPARLALILQDCGIRYLIAGPAQEKALAQAASSCDLESVIGLEGAGDLPVRQIAWSKVYRAPTTFVPPRRMEQDIAYLMYTSGSTGEPKGMVHTHHSGLSYAKLAAEFYGLCSEDRLSSFPPLHFDQSTFDYFSGPLAGATTVIIPEEHMIFPASLSQLMADERLSIWYSVPFALIQLLLRGALAERDLSSLRWVLYGGEPFPPKHLRELMALWPQARFSNVYGPAEVNQCTYYHLPCTDELDDGPIPIGRIWPNAEGIIVDEADQQVAPGEAGELLVRTPTMMQGYWRRPDLNARAFFQRTEAGGHSRRFYRTGDLVQQRGDGEMMFLGRKDRQVKARGYRVELDEVETVFSAHPDVEEAAVFAVSDPDAGAEIRAAVIVRAGAAISAAELIRHAQDRLPRYAVPTKLEFVADFPRTSTGKIDRQALQKRLAFTDHPKAER